MHDKRLSTLEDFENLNIGDKVRLILNKGKIFEGEVESKVRNRGYIDLNEITIYVYSEDYPITVNVTKYLCNESALKDFILMR